MLEVAQVLGAFSAALLLLAVFVWVNLLRGPEMQRLDGISVPNPRRAEIASQILAVPVALSALAAILAVAGWVSI